MIQTRSRPEPIRPSKPARVRHSKAGEVVWEMAARDFPLQGHWTEDEYRNIDNQRIEFVDGQLEFLPVPTETHEKIKHFLYLALFSFISIRGIGGVVRTSGTKIRVSTGKLREPDILFLFAKHSKLRHEDGWEGADLVMEIVSPTKNDRNRDYEVKRKEYAKAGIPEYWVIDFEMKAITVFSLRRGKYYVSSKSTKGEQAKSVVLKGFEADVNDVLAGA
jgi:Uma2 family endonuclease